MSKESFRDFLMCKHKAIVFVLLLDSLRGDVVLLTGKSYSLPFKYTFNNCCGIQKEGRDNAFKR